jgi:hypothetical protein
MLRLRRFTLQAIILTIPLNQWLYFSIGSLTVKLYHVLLVGLVGLGFFQLREGKSLQIWQKFGLLFMLCSIISEITGCAAISAVPYLPPLPADATAAANGAIVLNVFLFADMWLAYTIVVYVQDSEAQLKNVLHWATLSAIIPTIYGLYQAASFFGGFEIPFLEFTRLLQRDDAPRGIFLDNGLIRIASTYFEPSPYGSYLGIIIPLIAAHLVLLQNPEEKNRRRLSLFVLGLAVLNLLLCFSTVGILAMLVFGMVWLWLCYSLAEVIKRAVIMGSLVLIVVLVTGFGELLWNSIDLFIIQKLTADESNFNSYSRLDRLRQAEIGWQIFQAHPAFGVGPYLPFFFELENAQYVFKAGTAISLVYLQILAQFGAAGSSVFIAFCGWLVSSLLKARQSDTQTRNFGNVLLALVACIGILMFALGSLLPLQLWLALGILIAYCSKAKAAEEIDTR